MRATRIFLASGGTLLVEAEEDRCWHSEEISEVEIEMEEEWECGICGNVYDPLDEDDDEEDYEQWNSL